MANPPRPRPPANATTTDTTRTVFIAFAIVGALLVAALAFILGQTAANPISRNLEEKLVLVRQKAATCAQERDRLRSKMKREPDYRKSPAYKIQEENDRLADQNNELMTDNESLRDEKAMLEETLTELRFELDKNSIINEEENKKLDKFAKTGNMSDALKAFIQEQESWGGVDKDELLSRLLAELKWKKQQFQRCTKDIVSAADRLHKANEEKDKKAAEAAKAAEAGKGKLSNDQLAAILAQIQKQQASDKPADKTAEVKKEEPKQEQAKPDVSALLEALKQTMGEKKAETKPEEKKAEEKKPDAQAQLEQKTETKVEEKKVDESKPVETKDKTTAAEQKPAEQKISTEALMALLKEHPELAKLAAKGA